VESGHGQTPKWTHEIGYCTLGYVDDTAILISEKLPDTVSEFLKGALGMVQQWCDRTQLSINPHRMVMMPFARRRGLRGLK
jgi:hypothetical protein